MERLFYAVADENGFGVYYDREDAFEDLGCLSLYDIHGLSDYDEAKAYAIDTYMKLSGDVIDMDSAIEMMEINNFYYQGNDVEDLIFESGLMDEYLLLMMI